MQIFVRNTEVFRRSANKFDHITPSWPLNKRLRAIALMLGHSSWEAFSASASPSNPLIVFDQDLGKQEFSTRQAEMAVHVQQGLGIEYVSAYEVVDAVRILSAINAPPRQTFVPDRALEQVMLKQEGLWWASTWTHGHPLLPPGVLLAEAIEVTELAKMRLEGAMRLDPDAKPRTIQILIPRGDEDGLHDGVDLRATYFRRGRYVEIERIPPEFILKAPGSNKPAIKEFFDRHYPELSAGARSTKLNVWLNDLASLRSLAGLSPTSRRPFQATLSCRRTAGLSWMFPLKDVTPVPTDAQAKAQAAAEGLHAEMVELLGNDIAWINPESSIYPE